MLCTFSQLDQKTIERIKSLEQELKRPIVAYSCLPGEPAPLTEEELAKIKTAEEQLGLTLVAMNNQEHASEE